MPLTSFLVAPNTGYLECPDSIILVIKAFGSSSEVNVTISTLGIMISLTVVSPKRIALSAIN